MGKNREGETHAQAAVEVLSYASFFLLVFVAAVALFLQLQGQELSRAQYAFAQQVAFQFADNIKVAFVAGPGFSQTVSMPPLLLGKNYTITVSRPSSETPGGYQADTETGFVYVEWQSSSGTASVSAPTLTTSYDFVRCAGITSNTQGFVVIIPSQAGPFRMYNLGGTIKFACK